MNLLRRFLLLIYGLALLALVTVSLLFPDTVANALLTLGTTSPTARGIVVAVIDVAIVIALFLLIRSPRRENVDGLIVKTPGARADINISSARDLILKAVRDVPNVVSAEVKLTAPQGKADIDLAVEVAGSNVNVPNKQREIDRALRQVALKQLGLQLANQPRVHIQLVTEEELRAREEAARPLPPPPPVTPVTRAPETWTPAPYAEPPVTRAPEPMIQFEPVPPVAAVVPPPPPEEPSASDFVLASAAAPPAAWEAPWGEGEPGDGLLVESAPSDEPVFEPAMAVEEPVAPVDEPLPEPPLDFMVPPVDEPLPEPPLDFMVPPVTESEPTTEIDASILDDIDPDGDDWLSDDSSSDEQTGLYAEEDAPSRRPNGETAPPMPDLD